MLHSFQYLTSGPLYWARKLDEVFIKMKRLTQQWLRHQDKQEGKPFLIKENNVFQEGFVQLPLSYYFYSRSVFRSGLLSSEVSIRIGGSYFFYQTLYSHSHLIQHTHTQVNIFTNQFYISCYRHSIFGVHKNLLEASEYKTQFASKLVSFSQSHPHT